MSLYSEKNIMQGADDWTVPESIKKNPLFVEVGDGDMGQALETLDKRMRSMGYGPLITSNPPHSIFGRTVESGRIGLWNKSGRPVIAIKPGCYWNFDPSMEWATSMDLKSHVEFLGLTMVQVGQGEAIVVQDPQNRIFVIRNGGFAAYGISGRFKIVALVDILDLGDDNLVKEVRTNRILGWKKDIKMSVMTNGQQSLVTVAVFFNVPANNVVIVQQGDQIMSLGAGQHVITNPHMTFRGFYSLSERQHSFTTQPAYTVEGVPVVLNVNLRYRVKDPIQLTKNYEDPLQALINPAQTAVNSVVSRMSYQQFMRAKKISGDVPDDGHLPWLEEFKSACLTELEEQATCHGIVVESFDVMDRKLEGSLGMDLERQAEQVLKNQIDATQIELRNSIKAHEQRGQLEVAKIQNEVTKTKADTEFYAAQKAADAKYYTALKEAAAEAEASAIVTDQQAKNSIRLAEAKAMEIEMQGKAYASVQNDHAQFMQKSALEVEKRRVMPSTTMWFEGANSGTVQEAFAFGKGLELAKKSIE